MAPTPMDRAPIRRASICARIRTSISSNDYRGQGGFGLGSAPALDESCPGPSGSPRVASPAPGWVATFGHAIETLGYRRYEWKCDALNAASRRAALRLGFRFEGIFRDHMIIKGRGRDTAWF